MDDRLFQLPCVECEQPMTWRSGPNTSWDGDYEFVSFQFECQAAGCQCTATVEYRIFIPVDIARKREAS